MGLFLQRETIRDVLNHIWKILYNVMVRQRRNGVIFKTITRRHF